MAAHRGMMALGSLTVFQRLVIAAFLAWTLSLGQALAQASQLPLGEQCFSALAPTSGGPGGTGTGYIGLLGTITAGSGGVAGTYSTPLIGGSGTNASANIVVGGGGGVISVSVYNPGTGYVVGDTLSAASANIGGVTGFSVPVSSVAVNQALAGGSVGYYIPGTLTGSQTWKNAAETILNPNPIPLDANGCAIVYGAGTYRQIVMDANGNTVWDQNTSTFSVASGSITNSQLAQMPADTVKCNNTATATTPTDCTQGQLTALVNVFTSLLPGAVPASGGGVVNFLRADGTFAQPASGSILVNTLTASNSTVLSDTTSFATTGCGEFELRLHQLIPATSGVILELLAHSGGSFQSTSYQTQSLVSASTSVVANAAATTYIPLSNNNTADLGNATGIQGTLKVANVASTSVDKIWDFIGSYVNATPAQETAHTSGTWTGGTGAIDGFEIKASTGNLTSGTVEVYCNP